MLWGFIIIGIIIISALIIKLVESKKLSFDFPEIELTKDGSGSILFDQKKNAVIIPFAKDEYGRGRASAPPIFLKFPYTSYELGAAVKKGINLSSRGSFIDSKTLMEYLESSDWESFSKGRRNISVLFKADKGIILDATLRKSDGSYLVIPKTRKVVTDYRDSSVLGEEVLKVLSKSKC